MSIPLQGGLGVAPEDVEQNSRQAVSESSKHSLVVSQGGAASASSKVQAEFSELQKAHDQLKAESDLLASEKGQDLANFVTVPRDGVA